MLPTAALDTLEELLNGRLKPHEMLWGIVIFPVVVQHYWFKRFVKVTYIYFFIPDGSIPEWPSNSNKALTIGLYFPFSDTNPGTGLKSSLRVYWEAHCQRCTALTWHGKWIFCANLCVSVIGFPLCHRAWCARCYHHTPGTSFLVYQGSYPDTLPIPNEDLMYLQARPGDSIYFSFECDECSFYRLIGSPSHHNNHIHKNLIDYV